MKWHRIRNEIRKNLIIERRHQTRFWFALLMPTIFMVLFGLVFGGEGGTEPILYYVDADQTSGSAALVARLAAAEGLTVLPAPDAPTHSDAEDWALQKQVSGLLWIHAGYEARLAAHNETNTSAVGDGPPVAGSEAIEFFSTATGSAPYVHTLIAAAVAENALAEGGPVDPDARGFTLHAFTVRVREYRDIIIPGMVGVNVLYLNLSGTVSSAASARAMGLFRKLNTTPMSKMDWFVGLMVIQTLTTFVSVTMMLTVAWVFFQPTYHITLPLVGLILLGALMLSGLGLLIAGWVREPQMANTTMNILYMPMMFLSGTFFARDALPDVLYWVSNLFPLSYFIEAVRTILLFDDPSGALVDVAVVAAFGIAFLVAGHKLTRWEDTD